MNANSAISNAALLRYWRNTLADEDLMALDCSGSPVRTTMDAVNSGTLSVEAAGALQAAWQDYHKRTSWDRTAADRDAARVTSIPIIIFAKGFALKYEHGKTVAKRSAHRRTHYTLHIPATLMPNGTLCCSPESLPWIGREYLLPNEEADEDIPMVGELEHFDAWLSRNPVDAASWQDLIRGCEGLWEHVAGNRIPDGFTEIADVRIDIAKSTRNAGRQLGQLYDALLAEEKLPELLGRICQGRSDPAVVTPDLRREQLAAPRGTMSTAYGLANSQSDAVAAFTKLGPNEILAVNGPPGTGKTTLLQSIIATEVVTRAIAGGDPAVIVGTSTNNQAVVNINRSLNEILGENPAATRFSWAKRWIPDAQTYGLYLPAGDDKAAKAEKEGYAVAVLQGKRSYSGFPEREDDPDYADRARTMWLENYLYLHQNQPKTIDAGLEVIRTELTDIVRHLDGIQVTFKRFADIDAWWRQTLHDCSGEVISTAVKEAELATVEAQTAAREAKASHDALFSQGQKVFRDMETDIAAQEAVLHGLIGLKAKITTAMASRGIIEILAGLIRPLRAMAAQRRFARLCALAAQDAQITQLFADEIRNGIPAAWIARIEHLIDLADAKLRQQRDAKAVEVKRCSELIERADRNLAEASAKHNAALERLEQLKANAQQFFSRRADVQAVYKALREQAISKFCVEETSLPANLDGTPTLSDLDQVLDVTWRHKAFQLAMRYWEGRWILEAEGIREGKVNTKSGSIGMEARFRRWCMLTPCLVITLHSLPKHFRYRYRANDTWLSNYMLGFIDLLVMDEAGQVGPHIGAAGFALAKRAVVVGDIYQIEPVSKVSRSTDYANSARYGFQDLWRDGEPAYPHLVSEPDSGGPQGSIMRLAQGATNATSPETEGEPGIFLSEHRRCRSEIVEFCNRLVYRGRLEPLSQSRKKTPPIRPLAWAHVRGTAKKMGGSNANQAEAMAISQWITANADQWCRHYDKSIEDVVAIITPFRPQARLIEAYLKKTGSLSRKITVGTVHSLQGAEKPIIIFSPTYDADSTRGGLFFDRKPNMLNVAVSRAKDSFVVIGDMRLFRRKGQSPSAILGSMLFADDANELPDVDGNYRFSRELLVQGERISTLDRHREVLRQALTNAAPGRTVLIASPWISIRAVEDDGLVPLVADAVRKGAQVQIVVDGELALQNPKHRGARALAEMRKAGAIVTLSASMHSKTLIAGPTEIIEGSFNWLSANRHAGDPYARHETSWRIVGNTVAPVVQSAMEEFSKLEIKPAGKPLSTEP